MYVLFKEDPNTHKEIYVRVVAGFALHTTRKLEDARKFQTASEAYVWAERSKVPLDWWRVGVRP